MRGSLGNHEQGLIITTSDFSRDERDEAIRTNATTDKSIVARLKNEKVGIVSVNSTHLGSTVAYAMSPVVRLGVDLMSNDRADYVATLNRDSVAAVDSELCKATAFQYVPDLNPDALANQTAIAQAIASKGLRWGLGLEIDYGIITGFHRKLASKMTWLLYDTSGSRKVVITTIVSSGRQVALLPNTKNADFHDDYVAIDSHPPRRLPR